MGLQKFLIVDDERWIGYLVQQKTWSLNTTTCSACPEILDGDTKRYFSLKKCIFLRRPCCDPRTGNRLARRFRVVLHNIPLTKIYMLYEQKCRSRLCNLDFNICNRGGNTVWGRKCERGARNPPAQATQIQPPRGEVSPRSPAHAHCARFPRACESPTQATHTSSLPGAPKLSTAKTCAKPSHSFGQMATCPC